MNNREISNSGLCKKKFLPNKNVSNCRIHFLIHFFYLSFSSAGLTYFTLRFVGYRFKWIWHVSSAVNCIFSVMQRTMQFSSSTERDLIEIELPVLCAVMQKLQHFRMCQSICVAFTDTKRDHFCAD